MTSLVRQDQRDLVVDTPQSNTIAVTPMQLLQMAMTSGADMDRLERLMEMHKSWQADQARMAFADAMAAFKRNPPKIIKDSMVKYDNVEYMHASLGNVCSAIVKSLSEHGISHRWTIEQANNIITVTCVLTHIAGHSESTVISSPPDSSGKKNSIQAVASTVTYLQRYTLLSATGTATNEADDDGRGSDTVQRITESQAADLRAKAEEVGANIPAFLKFIKVERFEDLPASSFSNAINFLEQKARSNKK